MTQKFLLSRRVWLAAVSLGLLRGSTFGLDSSRTAAPQFISASPNGLFQITALFEMAGEDDGGGYPVLRSLNWFMAKGKLHPFAGWTRHHLNQDRNRMGFEAKWSPDSSAVAVALNHSHVGMLDILTRSKKGDALEMLSAWNKFDPYKEINRFAAKQVPPETPTSSRIRRLWLTPLQVTKDEIVIKFSGWADVEKLVYYKLKLIKDRSLTYPEWWDGIIRVKLGASPSVAVEKCNREWADIGD